ncbi:PTS sugar transporter subunit IIB [Candidatus Stoquefichus sp. SB1]|jgi:PTS system cellobiose-specific IIB component|uniref:PTS sugar transporter subunit IIB n=1 Tax=Candidatus Stoquefichus sp. SB1 TaxID=1658109 RepID=UPI00067E684E|nr:PTS sugar transporter subunit IIB [Candidatus Stoquefichus sp. SB1]
MLKIVLCCSAAMSTSLLVEKIKKAASKINYPVEVYATGLTEIEKIAYNADIIIMAPQVQYAKKQIRKQFSPIPVIDVSIRDYGLMNGQNVFKEVLQTLNKDNKKTT